MRERLDASLDDYLRFLGPEEDAEAGGGGAG